MAKNTVTPIKKQSQIQAFTFEVTMLVQVLGDDATKAREQLDSQGGYVSRRDVALVSATPLFNGKASA